MSIFDDAHDRREYEAQMKAEERPPMTETPETPMVGEAVTWHYAPRGGYTFEQAIPAVVVDVSGKRVMVAVLRERDGVVLYRHVTRARLGPPLAQGNQIIERLLAALAATEWRSHD